MQIRGRFGGSAGIATARHEGLKRAALSQLIGARRTAGIGAMASSSPKPRMVGSPPMLWAPPGEQIGMRRVMVEADAAPCQRMDIRRRDLRAVTADIGPSHIVH